MDRLNILVFLFFLSLPVFSQINEKSINGTWQFKTPVLTSGLLDSYKFDANTSSFEFRPNEYNGLNRVLSIGGIYEIQKDTILFIVKYTIEYTRGYPIRSKTNTLSDSWEIIGGKIEKIELKNKDIEKATITKGFDKDKRIEYILIDNRIYYKIKSE